MNEHNIVNGIFTVIAIVVFIARLAKKRGAAAAQATAIPNMAVIPSPATALRAGSVEGQPPATKLARVPAGQPAKAIASRQPAARTAAPQQAVAMYQEAARPAAKARPPVRSTPDFGFPAEAAAAFPVLDLTLPGDAPDALAPVRARRRAPRGGFVGSAGWSANAIVALEVLGPPVSLRSGATLGAPHAF